jgi:gluconate 2-dehydrogenase gamma chain
MPKSDVSRRDFLLRAGTGLSAVWLSSHWSGIVAAATHARHAVQSSPPPNFQFFSAEEAREIDAISARIIPSDSTPGAREAGVVYFMDRALATFAADSQGTYKRGLTELQAKVREMFPDLARFSDGTPAQQDEILRSLDQQAVPPGGRAFRSSATASSFFETIRAHTVVAFLIDPESGGNRGGVGWKLIGRDLDHTFQPPFGYYDKDYPGWQPPSRESAKSKA